MSFSRHDFTLSRLRGPITGSVLEAPGPSQTTSTGSSCPSIISAERRADGRSASCGAHNRGASAIRRAAFISNLCVEKAQVCALAEETQQKRRGKKAGRQLFSLIAPIIGLHQGGKKKIKPKRGNRLYTIGDKLTIIHKFSYILTAGINTISYNGSNICSMDISMTQNSLMQYNAR